MFFIHPNIWNEQNSRSLNSERFGEPQVSGDGPRFLTDSDTKTVTIAGGTHDNQHVGQHFNDKNYDYDYDENDENCNDDYDDNDKNYDDDYDDND